MVYFPGIKWKFKSDRENLIPLLIVAVLIGMLTGALAVGFRYLLLVATRICWQNPFDIIGAARDLSWYIVVLIPVLSLSDCLLNGGPFFWRAVRPPGLLLLLMLRWQACCLP